MQKMLINVRVVILVTVVTVIGKSSFAQGSIDKNAVYFDSAMSKQIQIKNLNFGVWFRFNLRGNVTFKIEASSNKSFYVTQYLYYKDTILTTIGFAKYVKLDSSLKKEGLDISIDKPSNDTSSIVYWAKGEIIWYRRYRDGKLKSFQEYDGPHKKDGLSVEYFPNGQIKVQGTYESNLRQGMWKEFYNDGQLKNCGNYSGLYKLEMVKSNQFGEDVESYREEAIWLKKGKWKYYDSSGERISVEIYSDDGQLKD